MRDQVRPLLDRGDSIILFGQCHVSRLLHSRARCGAWDLGATGTTPPGLAHTICCVAGPETHVVACRMTSSVYWGEPYRSVCAPGAERRNGVELMDGGGKGWLRRYDWRVEVMAHGVRLSQATRSRTACSASSAR